jgi:O-antigen/teichoic acid export membrane protein
MPEGTFVVGAGLIVAGITTYGFQILSFRALAKADYTALNALWVFVFVLAPGFFLPLEQEVARAVSDRRVRGLGGGPVTRRAAYLGASLATALVVVTIAAAFGTPIVNKIFNGSSGLVVCLALGLVTYCVQHVTRGTLSGNGRFGPYGVILAAEGVIRLLPCAVLAIAGVADPLAYGLCLAVPPVIATAVSVAGQHGLLAPGPEARWSELSSNLGYLLGGSLCAQALSYAPFLGAQLLSTSSEKKAVADFIVGLFLSRVPILLFQAVQAALLPKLAALAGAGRHDEFRNGLRKLVTVVVVIGALGVVAGGTVGPIAGKILFGSKFNLGNGDVALLAAGSALFILALTLAQGLIALMGHARALVGWVVGLVAFVVVAGIAGSDLFLRVEVGFIAGALVSAATMAGMLLSQIRAGVPEGSLAELVEQIEHEPLEL